MYTLTQKSNGVTAEVVDSLTGLSAYLVTDDAYVYVACQQHLCAYDNVNSIVL